MRPGAITGPRWQDRTGDCGRQTMTKQKWEIRDGRHDTRNQLVNECCGRNPADRVGSEELQGSLSPETLRRAVLECVTDFPDRHIH